MKQKWTLAMWALCIAFISVLFAISYSCAVGYQDDSDAMADIEIHDVKAVETTKIPIATKETESAKKQTLTKSGGVFYFNGKTEKYYSSKSLYHYRTPELTLDSLGFYHDVDGLLFVASSDYALGTIIETSMGTARVCDCGCPCGVIDFYVNW